MYKRVCQFFLGLLRNLMEVDHSEDVILTPVENNEGESQERKFRPTTPLKTGRRCSNGEKVRLMLRLRKLIDEFNHVCEENVALVVVKPDPTHHMSYYGSRSLVKALYHSSLLDVLKDKETYGLVDQSSVYIPVTSFPKSMDYEDLSDTQIYSQVLHLLDLYNYPAKEHFSYKVKNRKDRLPRPKPVFWPKDVTFRSLVGGSLSLLAEPDSGRMFLNRKEVIVRVMWSLRQYYRLLIDRLNGIEQEEEEDVDIENVAHHEELETSEQDTMCLVKKEVLLDVKREENALEEDTDVRPSSGSPKKKTRVRCETTGPSPKKRKSCYPQGSVGQALSRHKWSSSSCSYSAGGARDFPSAKGYDDISSHDRVITLNPATISRSSYAIKTPTVDTHSEERVRDAERAETAPDAHSELNGTVIQSAEMLNGCTVLIDGQEYTVVEGDDIDVNDVYEEIAVDEPASFSNPNGNDDVESADLLLPSCSQVSADEHHQLEPMPTVSSLDEGSMNIHGEPVHEEYVLSQEQDHELDYANSPLSLQVRPRACRLVKTIVVDRPDGPVLQKYIVKRRHN